MSMSVRQAYKIFVTENSDVKVSLTKFLTMKPKNIILLTRKHHVTCKCPYCQNVEFIMASINRKISLLNLESEIMIVIQKRFKLIDLPFLVKMLIQ